MVYLDTIFRISENSSFHYAVQEDADALGLVEISYIEENDPKFKPVRMIMTPEIARKIAEKMIEMANILDSK